MQGLASSGRRRGSNAVPLEVQYWVGLAPLLPTWRRRRSPDPGRYGLVAAAPGVVPSAREDVSVLAELTLVIGRGTSLTEPDRERGPFKLVGVVERVARAGVEAALHVRARLAPQRPLVADDLHALGLRSEVDVLDEEESALHPLVGHPPPHVPGEVPGADQPVEGPERGARFAGLLPVTLSIAGVVVVSHEGFPFPRDVCRCSSAGRGRSGAHRTSAMRDPAYGLRRTPPFYAVG